MSILTSRARKLAKKAMAKRAAKRRGHTDE